MDLLISLGENAKNIVKGFGEGAVHYDDRKKMAQDIAAMLKPGDTIVFKASHSMRYEDILADVYAILDNNKEEAKG